MKLGKVIGTVVSTVKDGKLTGPGLRIVELISENGSPLGDYEVAMDTVGARKDDIVLTVKSSSARMTRVTESRPVDDAIIAIVDMIEMDGKLIYHAG